jgi:flavorubredoxin
MGGKGGSPKILADLLNDSGFKVINQNEVLYVPNDEEQEKSFELGKKLAQEAKKL